MQSELSFLIDLLMNHKLQKVTKDLIAQRIRDVESVYSVTKVHIPIAAQVPLPPNLRNQAPSTLAAMARHGDIPTQESHTPPTAPAAVEVIAQTPAAAQAMALRQQAIAQSLSGKPEKGATSPRKW